MDLDILYKFFGGKASLQEEKQIREWLELSEENKDILLRERQLFDAYILFGDQETEPVNNYLPPHRSRKIWFDFLKIGAAVIITILAGWLYLQVTEDVEEPKIQTISVPAGQQINLTLPDGSNIWINARTTIQYPMSFGKKERLVKLDGEAYFDIAKDENYPFIVETSKSRIEVLGTTFNVMAYSESEAYEVALIEGKVKINIENETRTLSPQHKVYLDKGKLKTARIEDYSKYRWKEGLICFNEESFDQIIRKLEESYGITFIIKNKKMKGVLYTGKFRLTDGVDYALRVLQKDIKFRYTRDDGNNTIYIE